MLLCLANVKSQYLTHSETHILRCYINKAHINIEGLQLESFASYVVVTGFCCLFCFYISQAFDTGRKGSNR